MTETISTEIARYTRGIERAVAWIAEQEAARGVVGMDPSDQAYPAALVSARAKADEFRDAISDIREKADRDAIPPIAATVPDSRRPWIMKLAHHGCPADVVAKALFLETEEIAAFVTYLQLQQSWGYHLEPDHAKPMRPVTLKLVGNGEDRRAEVRTSAGCVVGHVAKDRLGWVSGRLCNGVTVPGLIVRTPSQIGRFHVFVGLGIRKEPSFALFELAGTWEFRYPDRGLAEDGKGPDEAGTAAWTPPAWVRDAEDDGSNVFAIADALPDKHALAWIDERNRQIRLATASVPPFDACIDLGRNLGAPIQIRPAEDGEAWEVAHDCAWGGNSYVSRFRGRHVTRRGAFSVAAKAIRAEATIPIEAAKDKDPKLCIGAQDVQRANKILGWLNTLTPPGPDEVVQERAAA